MLQHNTLKLQHAIAMSIAAMSPVGAILFNTIPQAGLVGAAIPLCYAIGLAVALLVAVQVREMAAEFPTSGSLYTFVAQGSGVGWGFIAGWLSLISFGVAVPATVVVTSANLQALLLHASGVNLHWSLWYCLLTLIVGAICYRGARFSLGLDLVLSVFQVGVCLLLAFVVLINASKTGQLTLVPFTLQGLPQNSNLVLGVILAILSFVGFESATTLGEEVQNPRKAIPIAMTIALVLVGIFYLLMAYVATIGYGIDRMANFAQDAAPFDTIARRVWGNGLALAIDVAGIIAGYACAVAFLNGAARIVYAMGRELLFPAWFARIHPIYRTPTNAIWGLSGMSLVVGLGLGMLWTPIEAYAFLGTLLTLAALIIYGLVNLACFRYFAIQRRGHFHWFRHLLLPWFSTTIVLALLIGTVYPSPPAPLNIVPIIIFVWLLLGVGVLGFLADRNPEVLLRAGKLFGENDTNKID